MSTAVVIRPRVSIDEYLAMEAAATEKHILWDGEVFSVEAMSGGTFDHGTISASVIAALHTSLRGSRCRVVTSDVKVWVPLKAGFVYPDATVVCGRAEAYPGTTDVLTNPSLLIEVLSEGTEKFDRGDKFEGYRTIPTLRHYVMVSSKHRLVEHYERAEGDAWTLRTYGPGSELRVKGPDAALAVDELYRMAFEDDAG
jgi:Uma2 family endonuclease